MDLTGIVKMRIANTDLEYYKDKDDLIEYALMWSEHEINTRRRYIPSKKDVENGQTMEQGFMTNKIEGAVYYLSRIGAENYSSTTENGVSITWNTIPDFLSSIIPLLKPMVKKNAE